MTHFILATTISIRTREPINLLLKNVNQISEYVCATARIAINHVQKESD